ncbi:MAG: hypothetical protein IJQ80_04180, partial [Clostridia bacterium]|nr:hypothetical protein [Clostridia bacterium]
SIFDADTFKTEGDVRITERAILIAPSDDAVSVAGEKIGSAGEKLSAIARVLVDGADSGTLTFSVKNDGDEDYTDISAATLFPGSNSYNFIYDVSSGDDSYRLTFASLTASSGDAISLEGVSFSYFDAALSGGAGKYSATISSLSVSADGTTVSASGNVASSFAASNKSGTLGLYAVDMWGEEAPTLLATTDMTTVFEITADVSSLPSLSFFYKYYIASVADDSESPEPLSQPIYPSQPLAAPRNTSSCIGIESDRGGAAFDANAAFSVKEIFCDRLMGADATSGKRYVFRGETYYYDTYYAAELDRTISFDTSSGVSVYLRLLLSSSDSIAVYSALNAEDRGAVMRYAAAVDFLTRRYPDVYGIIVGCRTDCFVYNGGIGGDILNYAKNYARGLRITSSVAHINIPSCVIVAPFGDGYLHSDAKSGKRTEYDPVTGLGKSSCDPMLLSVLISKFMSEGGSFPWYVMYECEDDPAGAAKTVAEASDRLVQNVGASPSGHILYWRPEGSIAADDIEKAASEYSEIAPGLMTRSFIISFLSADGDTESLIDAVKGSDIDGNGSRTCHKFDALASIDNSTSGHYLIKDLRNSYGTGDFFAGAAFSEVTTVDSPELASLDGAEAGRAIRAEGDASAYGGGILMTIFPDTLPISSATFLNIALCVTSEDDGPVRVRISLGSEGNRCEYECDAKSGVASVLSCRTDRAPFAAASYLAIEVLSDGSVTLDVSRISVSRDDGDEKALSDAFGQRTEAETTNEGRVFPTLIVAIAILSVAIFAALSIRPDHRTRSDGAGKGRHGKKK